MMNMPRCHTVQLLAGAMMWATCLSNAQVQQPAAFVSTRVATSIEPENNIRSTVGPVKSVVFSAGEHDYSCIRVPSLVQTQSRVLLAFAEARKSSCADQAPKDVVMKRSHDLGATWSNLTVVVGRKAGNYTYRNPYATVVKNEGDGKDVIILNYVNSTLSEPWINLQKQSTDDGATWGTQQVVSLPKSVEGVLPGPGDGIQLGTYSTASPKPGRLVLCGATGYHAGHSMNTVVWYSDDSGATYTLSASIFSQFQECQLTELANGTLLMTMRNSHLNPCKCRASSISLDAGQTWSPVRWDSALIEPVCSAGLITTSTPSPGQLFFSNPHSASSRTNMTIMTSTDSGATWRVFKQVYPGPSAYSVLVDIRSAPTGHAPASAASDELVGILYERGDKSPYEEIAFESFTLDDD